MNLPTDVTFGVTRKMNLPTDVTLAFVLLFTTLYQKTAHFTKTTPHLHDMFGF